MLRRNDNKGNNAGPTGGYTFLEKGTVINGELTASGHVRLDGQIHGNVTVRGNLEVSAGASLEGEQIGRAHV